jgi:hypothetical protein
VRALAAFATLVWCTVCAVVPVSEASSQVVGRPDEPVVLLQMNLCSSGYADCYRAASYPAILRETNRQIAEHDPTAVTLNEVCSRDAARIARLTGYHLRFAAVDEAGAPLPCANPGGRGVFGMAVLTLPDVTSAETRAFSTQSGEEARRWLCVTSASDVTFCTAHLDTRASPEERMTNDAQCRDLRRLLAGFATTRATFFAGDVNRVRPCAPTTMWVERDAAAAQLPGIQHVYGTVGAYAPNAHVTAAQHTDHDVLFVTRAP